MTQPDLEDEQVSHKNSPVTPEKGIQRLDILLLALATVAVTLVTFLFGLLGSDGNLAAPLDDTFIHFQYARQIAAGHPFEYNTGDLPSSGDTSFIYPFLLAPAFLLGIDGAPVILYAIALGFVAHLAAVLLLYKLALLLFNRPAALLSASLLLLDGRTNWHALTGMETILYMGALVAFFYAWARGTPNNRFLSIALLGALTALLRPEGHILVSVICLATLVYLWRSRTVTRQSAWLLLPILIGILPYAINIAFSGSWQINTAAGKSSFFIPYLPFFQQLRLVPVHFYDVIRDTYLGLEMPFTPFPLFITLPFMAIGAIYALSNRQRKPLNTLLLASLALGVFLALLPRNSHFDRYFQPYNFLIWLYFAAGLVWLVAQLRPLFPPETSSKTIYAGIVGTVVLLMLPQFIRFFFIYGESNRDIYYQQMVFSYWLRDNTPVDARIGVNDVGAHKYLSDRYVVDLVGLTDNRFRGVFYSGWGSIYDVMAASPEDERPDYILIHPDFFINDTGASITQGFLTPLYSIIIQNLTITAGAVETLYKVNWDRASINQSATYLLHTGEAYYDAINIGDLADEKFHKYSLEGRQASIIEPKSILTTGGYDAAVANLTESGRRHTGLERFTVKSIPGRPLNLVSRSLLNPEASQRLKVLADGKEVGFWEVRNDRAGAWQEYEYTIPADFITGDHTTITIDASFDPGGPGFISYRYWIYVQ